MFAMTAFFYIYNVHHLYEGSWTASCQMLTGDAAPAIDANIYCYDLLK